MKCGGCVVKKMGVPDLKNKLEEQLKEKTAELDVMKRKLNNLVLVFIVFVIGLVGGKLLLQ
jgi:hypothetical protein